MEEMAMIPLHTIQPKSLEFSPLLLNNHPAPYLPEWIKRVVENLDGNDEFGDPIFRIKWGQDIFRTIRGKRHQQYSLGTWIRDNEVYDIGTPRWIVEVKIAPEFLGLEDWDDWQQGSKPRRGLYTHHMTIQTPEGEYCLPDMRHLTELRAMVYRRYADWNGTNEKMSARRKEQMVRGADYIQKQEADKRFQASKLRARDIARERLKGRMGAHPNEGKARDPYAESKKLREQFNGKLAAKYGITTGVTC